MSQQLGEFLHTFGIDTDEARAERIVACENFLNKAKKYFENNIKIEK